MKKLLVKNIGMLATPQGKRARSGAEQGEIQILKDAWVLIEDGLISQVGTGAAPEAAGAEVVDAKGRLVTPGLVDAHTHLIFGGWRQNELGMKLHGKTYLEIQNAGGGIQSTTNATRQATEEELAEKAAKALDEMMGFGVTTCEAKSGYGLATDHELKELRVIRDLNERHPMDIVATFMGAHLVPAEYKANRAEYIRLVCEEMMPAVKEQGIAQFCDVFCEADTFSVEESRQVLEAGLKYGLRPKIHADEIEAIGGSQLAGELGAISAEHLIVCPPEGIESMAKGGVIACLLPATSFNLGSTFAPARDMVKAGVPVAMATDFNPGSCPCLNLQFVINLGCLKYKLTPEEVLTAVTLNGGPVSKNYLLREGDAVEIEIPDPVELRAEAEEIPLIGQDPEHFILLENSLKGPLLHVLRKTGLDG